MVARGTLRRFREGEVLSELSMMMAPTTWTPEDNLPLVLVAHGLLADGWFYGEPRTRQDLQRTANAGFILLATDMGGLAEWNTDDAVAAADAAIEYAELELEANVDRVSWIADSMGASLALRWAWLNPDRIGGIVTRLAAVDLDSLVSRDPSGVGATIESAFDNDWATNAPFVDPAQNTAKLARFADRWLTLWSTDDPLMVGEDVDTADGVEASSLPIGELAHSESLVWPEDGSSPIPAVYQARFIHQHGRRGLTTTGRLVQQEENRWLELAKTGAPFAYKGGDMTDSLQLESGETIWIGSDLFAQGGDPALPDGLFTSDAMPFDNGIIVETADREFSHQIYDSGTTGIAIIPDQTEFTDLIYWILAMAIDDGLLRISGTLVERTTGPFGERLDNHIITLDVEDILDGDNTNVLDVVPVNTDIDIFDVVDINPSTDGWVYITGSEFVPPFDGGFGQGDLSESFTRHRVARTPIGQLNDPTTWRYWTGSDWSFDQADSVPIANAAGQTLDDTGDFRMMQLGDEDWIGVDHQLVSHSVRYWRASAPQGPWTLRGSVPTPDYGRLAYGGTLIGQFASFVPHVPAPAGHVMVFVVPNNLGSGIGLNGQQLRMWQPRFVAVPTT